MVKGKGKYFINVENQYKRAALREQERRKQELQDFAVLEEWLRTPDGYKFLEEQAEKREWLYSDEGKKWLKTKYGDLWLKTTKDGAKYKQLYKSFKEKPQLTYEDIPAVETPQDKTVQLKSTPPTENYMLSNYFRERIGDRDIVRKIKELLPEELREDSNLDNTIRQLADGYEISVDELQKSLPRIREGGSNVALRIISILKDYRIIENKTYKNVTTWTDSQGRVKIEDPNSRLFDRNPFVEKISRRNSIKYMPKKGEQEKYRQFFEDGRFKNYNQFLSWLDTTYGQEFLTDQVHISGWLDTPDGQVWLDSENGRNWRANTAYGNEYEKLRSTTEGRQKFQNPLWDMLVTDKKDEILKRDRSSRSVYKANIARKGHPEELPPPTEQELITGREQDKALRDFSVSDRDIFKIRQEAIDAGHNLPSERLPDISAQGEPFTAPRSPRSIQDLSRMFRRRGKVGRWLPKPLPEKTISTMLEHLEGKPSISEEKALEYIRYLDSVDISADPNDPTSWHNSPIGREITEWYRSVTPESPESPEGLRVVTEEGVVKILSDWKDKSKKDRLPEDMLIEGDIDQSRWTQEPVQPSRNLPTEGKGYTNATNYYNLESLRAFLGQRGEKIKQHHLSKEEKPVYDFFEYNAAKIQGLIDLAENIKKGNKYFEGPIGTHALKIPPRGARYFTKTPIPKRGDYGPGPSHLNVATSYMQLRELLGNMFGMDKETLDLEVYDYSTYGGAPVQIQWLKEMGLLKEVEFEWTKVLQIDARNKPKDYYVDPLGLGRPRWFPPGAPDGESLVLQQNWIMPGNKDIRYAKLALPSTSQIYYKQTIRKQVGKYTTGPSKGRPRFEQVTTIYRLDSKFEITKDALKSGEGLMKAFFHDFTNENQNQFTRNALKLIGKTNFATDFSNMKGFTALTNKRIEDLRNDKSQESIKIDSPIKSTPEQIRQTGSPKWQIPDKETFLRKVFQEYVRDEQKLIEERREDRPKYMRRDAWARELELKINPETYAERVQDKISQVRNLIGQSGGEVKGDFLNHISPEDINFWWNSKEIINENTGRINARNIDELMQSIKTVEIISPSGVDIPVEPTKPILEAKPAKSPVLTSNELTHKKNIMRRLQKTYEGVPKELENISKLTNDQWRQMIEKGKESGGGLSATESYLTVSREPVDPHISPPETRQPKPLGEQPQPSKVVAREMQDKQLVRPQQTEVGPKGTRRIGGGKLMPKLLRKKPWDDDKLMSQGGFVSL